MPKLFDRVKVNIATTGTGAVTFGPASSPAFLTPAQAGAQDGHKVRYTLVDGADFEEGVGTIFSSVAQMARTTVTRSKIGGNVDVNKIDLSGTAVLVFTVSAADILNPENNLSDVESASAARSNLGLGSAATAPASAFLQPGNNLADVGNAGTARSNLGLGSAAVLSNADVVRTDLPQGLSKSRQQQARANVGLALKNYIINGAMMVSQENGTAAGTGNQYYPVDQFAQNFVNSAVVSLAQVASNTPAGSPNRLRATVTTADTSITENKFHMLFQHIEGYRIANMMFGSAGTRYMTLRFGVKAPAGTYCISLQSGGQTRHYVAEYTIAAGEANTDVYKSVTFPVDTAGIWNRDFNIGLRIWWTLATGSTYHIAPNAWGTKTGLGTSNQFNFLGAINNVFELFDVGLYDGSSAPDFIVPDYLFTLRCCKRYWESGQAYSDASSGTGAHGEYFFFNEEKRSVPTVVPSAASGSPTVDSFALKQFRAYNSSNAFYFNWTATARM